MNDEQTDSPSPEHDAEPGEARGQSPETEESRDGAAPAEPHDMGNSEGAGNPTEGSETESGAGDSGVDQEEAGLDREEPGPEEVQRRVEALLFAAAEPLTAASMARSAGSNAAAVRSALKKLSSFYDESGRAFQLQEISGGFQLLTRPEFGSVIAGKKDDKPQRLSPAALETLSVIAYEQPVTRLEVESIRGVASGPVIRNLLEKGLVKVTGRSDQIGNPLLYGTTNRFLEVFGLTSLKDLPEPDESGS